MTFDETNGYGITRNLFMHGVFSGRAGIGCIFRIGIVGVGDVR